ncbi:MAG TPA: DUF5018 domain-containing protein, partial [Salinivirgaceae bacterium]|nr:DUF5018 domain-containing protein [Salinivirgaceae bacterium]
NTTNNYTIDSLAGNTTVTVEFESIPILLMVENFDYNVGDSLVNHGWVAHSASGTYPIIVVSPGLEYPNYLGSGVGNAVRFVKSGEDVNKPFSNVTVTSGTVYAAFLVNFEDAGTVTAGDYFAHFMTSGTTTFRGRIFVRKDASNNLSFGVTKGALGSSAVWTDYTYSMNTTYLMVLKYKFIDGVKNDSVSLFINPTIGAAEPTPTIAIGAADTSDDIAKLDAFALRQGSSANGSVQKLDAIRVARTWEEAVKLQADIFPPVATFTPANGATNVAWSVTPTIAFNEPIYNIGGGEINNTNVANILTFVDQNNNPIGFTATINDEKTLITLTPSAQLQPSTSYTISVLPVQDIMNNASAVQSATFTTVSAAPTLTITSPANGAIMPIQNVSITFNVTNFTIGAVGSGADGHIKYVVNGGAPAMHYTTNAIEITGLGAGNHTVVLELVNDNDESLTPAVTSSVSFIFTPPATGELFFSEYIEGSSNNKAIEIYNPNPFPVDLSQYSVILYSNGSSTATNTLTLSGTLAANSVYVIANASANAAILAIANDTSNVTFFNGDDALGLYKNGVLIDVFGTIGFDPGTAWDVAGVTGATADHTLVRKPFVSQGNTNWTAQAGTNADNSEWIVNNIDNFTNLGTHMFGLNNQANITSFSLPQQTGAATINNNDKTISIEVLYGTDVTSLVPTFTLSYGATASVNGVQQISGVSAVDFTNPVVYHVVAENGVDFADWTVTVTISTSASSEAEIVSFDIPGQIGQSVINSANATVSVTMPYGTNLTALVPTITISVGATIIPASGVAQNFTSPVQYTVTAQNGTQKVWTVNVTTLALTTIYQIQYTTDPSGASPLVDQIVTTAGVVTAIHGTVGFYLQDGEGEWNGIYVYKGTQAVTIPEIGSRITISAKVAEYYGLTELKNIEAINVISTGNALPDPISVTADQIGESVEGVLVMASNYECVHNGSGNFWTSKYVRPSAPNDTLFVFRQMYTDFLPTVGKTYTIVGPVTYDFGQFKMAPRNADDVTESQENFPPQISNIEIFPDVPTVGQPAYVRATITDDGGQENLVNKLYYGFDSNNLSNMVNFVPVGTLGTTYVATIPPQTTVGTLYFRIVANDGELESTYDGQIILTSINGQIVADVVLYPNPVENELWIMNGFGEYIITNLLGQEVQSGVITDNNSTINVSGLKPGYHFIRLISKDKQALKSFIKK